MVEQPSPATFGFIRLRSLRQLKRIQFTLQQKQVPPDSFLSGHCFFSTLQADFDKFNFRYCYSKEPGIHFSL